MSTEIDLTGCYDVVYSPDDESEHGAGYYADMLWDRTLDSPLFTTPQAAAAWAVDHGGIRRMRG